MASIEQQLHNACDWNGSYDKVKEIILANPNLDINFRPRRHHTALHNACYYGHADIVELLLYHFPNIDLNIENLHGNTPLWLACAEGHPEVVKILINDHRVDINKPNYDNKTPTWRAARNGNLECIELLLACNGINQKLDIQIDAKAKAYLNGRIKVGVLLDAFELNPIKE